MNLRINVSEAFFTNMGWTKAIVIEIFYRNVFIRSPVIPL